MAPVGSISRAARIFSRAARSVSVSTGARNVYAAAQSARDSFWLVSRFTGPLALSVGLLGLSSCRRQAPGPDECVAFAETWLRSEHRQAQNPLAVDAAFDNLVLSCLTEPYDRKLVECVVGGQPRDRCRVDYARRLEARRGDGEER